MSLRGKLIGLFFALAAGPLVAIGLVVHARSLHALHELIAAQSRVIADRAAADLRARYALRDSDLLLLAENAQTQQLLRSRAGGPAADLAPAHAAADAYLRRAWEQFARSYAHVELVDAVGASAYRLGDVGARAAAGGEVASGEALVVRRPIHDVRDGRRLGTLVAEIRLDALLPREALEGRFGRAGYTMVLDRRSGRVVYHPRHAFARRPLAELFAAASRKIDAALLSDARGSFTYRENDSTRVAAFASLADPPWTVLSAGTVEEFATPFTRASLVNLCLVLAVTSVAAAAFVVLIRRGTRSLEALTAAADEVGTGNFVPALPVAGRDEVGRLTAAFALMVAKVREMVREIETSRHMAAVGTFASRLAHEVRNPLTSLKLNLQSLQRDATAGRFPPDSARPVGICLREIERLDRVVGGALRLGREPSGARVPCAVDEVVAEALEVVRPQLEQQRVALRVALHAGTDRVRSDPGALKAAFLNLFLNAAEAMPDGGTLSVSSEIVAAGGGPTTCRIRIGDTGPGVPPDIREQIFEPFFSTKARGTGFGLPVALRTVEELGGQLRLADEGAPAGAAFLVDLPLAAERVTR